MARWVFSTFVLLTLTTSAHAFLQVWRFEDGGNGHVYNFLLAADLTWSEAQAAAEAGTFLGVNGHLATLTSQAENDFVAAHFSSQWFYSAWLGGWQEEGMSPAEGWHWVTGEPWSPM